MEHTYKTPNGRSFLKGKDPAPGDSDPIPTPNPTGEVSPDMDSIETEMIGTQCENCKHLIEFDFGLSGRCQAYPSGIPEDITKELLDHRFPQQGDGGIQFEPSEDSTEYWRNLSYPYVQLKKKQQ